MSIVHLTLYFLSNHRSSGRLEGFLSDGDDIALGFEEEGDIGADETGFDLIDAGAELVAGGDGFAVVAVAPGGRAASLAGIGLTFQLVGAGVEAGLPAGEVVAAHELGELAVGVVVEGGAGLGYPGGAAAAWNRCG